MNRKFKEKERKQTNPVRCSWSSLCYILKPCPKQFLCFSTRVVPSSHTFYINYLEPMWITVYLILHIRWWGLYGGWCIQCVTISCVTMVPIEGYWCKMVPLFATIVKLCSHCTANTTSVSFITLTNSFRSAQETALLSAHLQRLSGGAGNWKSSTRIFSFYFWLQKNICVRKWDDWNISEKGASGDNVVLHNQ